MTKIPVLTTFLLCCLQLSFAQTAADSISIQKTFGGQKFYQADKRLSMTELKNILRSNDAAYKELRSAQSANTLATIIGGAGGFMVGWPIGTSLGGGKANWVLAGIGAGLIVASIPISQTFNKRSKNAVAIFNRGIKTSSFWDKKELRFSVTAAAMGLTLRF
jgi:hypothetical protein